MQHLGFTRSSYRLDHLLLTPDTFVRAPLPGMEKATAIVHAGPALGAGFIQYTAELEAGGSLGSAPSQRFIYVLEGELTVESAGKKSSLHAGHYVYLPPGSGAHLSSESPARTAVIEKQYQPQAGKNIPEMLIGKEESVEPRPLLGDPAIEVRCLIPDDGAFDFAVNTMTFQPGASLPMVEAHIMQHGLLMLDGGGIYRLGESWYPVTAGDFIWMAPYCPQWFGAIGKSPARYLIYKDWNRHPLA
jgi:(S)-ureidoglycine aminohydrolase